MPIASWREPLDCAIERDRHQPHSRYFQLATVRTDGHPANRTVVFRGFLGETNQLKMVTDGRSEKAGQIYGQPWGEICWYFTETREQFRIAGQMTLVGAAHPDPELQTARSILWQELSDKARQQFLWPHPGTDIAGGDAGATAFSLADPADPEEHFCLLLLDPVMVDRLELMGDRHKRWIYLRDRDLLWSSKAINP
ncbi:MAG: Npun_F5749 family FMN-dependent PPOX-type flavoprotein [Hormoscilla sp.]